MKNKKLVDNGCFAAPAVWQQFKTRQKAYYAGRNDGIIDGYKRAKEEFEKQLEDYKIKLSNHESKTELVKAAAQAFEGIARALQYTEKK